MAKYLDMLLISGQVEMLVLGAAKYISSLTAFPFRQCSNFPLTMLSCLIPDQRVIQVNEPVLTLL